MRANYIPACLAKHKNAKKIKNAFILLRIPTACQLWIIGSVSSKSSFIGQISFKSIAPSMSFLFTIGFFTFVMPASRISISERQTTVRQEGSGGGWGGRISLGQPLERVGESSEWSCVSQQYSSSFMMTHHDSSHESRIHDSDSRISSQSAAVCDSATEFRSFMI